MNIEVDLGKVWLPQEVVEEIKKHRQSILDANIDKDSYTVLLEASFSSYFSDYMLKYSYKLLEG